MDLLLEDEKIREKQREQNKERKRAIKKFLKEEEKKGKLGGHDETGTRVTDTTPLKPMKNADNVYQNGTVTSTSSSSSSSSAAEELSLPSRPSQNLPTRTNRTKRSKKCNILKNGSQILGQGANGTVYMGLNTSTGELVAVKDINFKYAVKEVKEQINDIIKEITLMKHLAHPNIVRYYGAERRDTMLQIFMEYIPGGSLRSILKHFGKLQEKVVKRYSRQMLQGLEYLHAQGVAHLDVKSDNTLLDVSGSVKLADFGAAERLEGLSTKTVGTPCFMAPEVITGTGHTISADIWSFGITVIELLMGDPPDFGCKEPFAVMYKIARMTDPPPFPDGISSECSDLLVSCLQRKAGFRRTASELLQTVFVGEVPSEDEEEEEEDGEEPSSRVNEASVPVRLTPPTCPAVPPKPSLNKEAFGDIEQVKSFISATSRRTLANTAQDIKYINILRKKKDCGVITGFEMQMKTKAILGIRAEHQLTPCVPEEDIIVEEEVNYDG
eukprot:TRINITY_DN12807_c0_g1_i1.p1 TRINITY_DN12807_c0_g1~~TRINITY_DN12807_c0_g1_i1.p1  ORF type:complete len:497 (+),score=94.67 TRINITY_DN12807_c0_g1_i1:124-1614(+)